MKNRLVGCAVLGALMVWGRVSEGQTLDIEALSPGEVYLPFRPAITSIPHAAVSRQFYLEHSNDLRLWETLEEIPLANAYAYQGGLRVPSELLSGSQHYFRMRVEETVRYTTENADAYLGLDSPFTSALIERFFPQPSDLLSAYPERDDAGDLPWDVTMAEHWDLFDTDPAVNNVGRDPMVDGWRLVDYRLNDRERAIFEKQGFVVSGRLESETFGDAFYDLWIDDMPVFISTDALLQAWHYSFQRTLEEIDVFVMSTELEKLVDGLLQALEVNRPLYDSGDPFLRQAFEDLDGFLLVAAGLLSGSTPPSSFGDREASANLVAEAEAAEAALQQVPIFGEPRFVDFTQFKPRGHYVKSERLKRYFRAMMWCQRIDFRLTPPTVKVNPDEEAARASTLRQLAAAALLTQLLEQSQLMGSWKTIESVVAAVGGYGDALMPVQLLEILEAAELSDVGAVADAGIASDLQTRVLEGGLGIRNIRTHPTLSPLNSQQQAVLPRSFSFFSQRFVLDSWAMSKVVFDSIIFDRDGIPGVEDKVQRRIPSGLDMAFAALGNDAALPVLVERMGDRGGRAYRDGYPYQNNLAAVRSVIDAQSSGVWQGNIYHHWLGTLRQLSSLPSSSSIPHAMRTRAWAHKDLNTQLASWTQLRHDTILYAVQPATALTVCSFPDGYVEPRPAFWRELRRMAGNMQQLIAALPAEGSVRLLSWGPLDRVEIEIDVAKWRVAAAEFYANFAHTIGKLEDLVAKQLAFESFDEADITFIDELMQGGEHLPSSGGERRYDGWYPALFYQAYDDTLGEGSANPDGLVTDVHTDYPDAISGDPGTILHQAVGRVPLLLIAVEREHGRRAVYGGPVLSHYEFDTGNKLERLTDEDWQHWMENAKWGFGDALPDPGPWTEDYFVPAK